MDTIKMDYYTRKVKARAYIRTLLSKVKNRDELCLKVGDTYGVSRKFVISYLKEMEDGGVNFDL